jgi:hypothetical protein
MPSCRNTGVELTAVKIGEAKMEKDHSSHEQS